MLISNAYVTLSQGYIGFDRKANSHLSSCILQQMRCKVVYLCRKKGGVNKTNITGNSGNDPNRHGIFGPTEQKVGSP